MTALSIQPTFPIFTDIDGQPLEAGYIYIGVANLAPIGNPINVYWDAALTLPAAQPIRTIGGYPVNAGTPARLYVNSDYSIQVQNRNGSVVYSAPAATERYSGEVIEITFNDVTGQLGSDRVNFLQAGTGAVTRTAQSKMRDVVSVKDFGAVGDGVTDDTAAFSAAFAAHSAAMVPSGTWLVSQIVLAAGKSLLTDGKSTIIKQKSGQPSNTPIIKVTGENVEIGSLKATGNISTDTSEFNHVVSVVGNATNGAISNVTIGDIEGQNIRGDVLFIAAYTGYPVRSITAGNVTGDNIYRNVVSITGGEGVNIASINATRVGYATLVIEGESYTTPTAAVNIGYVKGSHAIMAGAVAASYADAINIGSLDLDPTFATESVPTYPTATTHALQTRNCKSIVIDKFKANGFDGQAIRQIFSAGNIATQAVNINAAEITNCCITEATYQTNILGEIGCTILTIQHLKGSVTRSGASMVRGCTRASIAQCEVALSAGTKLSVACDDAQFNRLNITGAAGTLTQSSNRIRFCGGSISTNSLADFANACIFEDLTVTTAGGLFVGGSGSEDHWFYNTTANGSFYGSGPFTRAHTQTIRFGANWLWVDSSGKLRIKSTTAPTSDTDGTVVGTQT